MTSTSGGNDGPEMGRRNTNPFADANDTIREAYGERNDNIDNGVVGGGKHYALASAASFPEWLSSWMASPSNHHLEREEDDDESLYHDCNDLSFSSSAEDETTSLLAKTAQQQSSPLRQMPQVYNSTSATPVRRNFIGDAGDLNSNIGRDAIANRAPPNDSIASPLAQALATWLAPYAQSAKRAGRNVLHFSEEVSIDRETESCASGSSNLPPNNNDAFEDALAEETDKFTVRFHPDSNDVGNEKNRTRKNSGGSLHRVSSSPALMLAHSDETWNNASDINTERMTNDCNTIVLKDIVVQGENDDGTAIHPWTKLILLEELGTAWSWCVLLLPYAFMILAIFLDGYMASQTNLGPLHGSTSCTDLVQGSVPTPFDASVKGYFPVPFRFVQSYKSGSSLTVGATTTSHGACTYPFELREGVGLLSHGANESADSNLTWSSSSVKPERTTIKDTRYRYLMSHGHAFTSGVIPSVPATAQSLRGSVQFNHLSSKAVALVARGSVLVSAIVFQRPTPRDRKSVV